MHRRLLPALATSTLTGASLLAQALPLEGPGVDPSDFRATVFAAGLDHPSGLAFLEDGSLLVATSTPPTANGSWFDMTTGRLLRFVDADDDGIADSPPEVLADNLPPGMTGLARRGSLVFCVTRPRGLPAGLHMLRTGATPADPFTLLGSIDFTLPASFGHLPSALVTRDLDDQTFELYFQLGSWSNTDATEGTFALSGLVSGMIEADSVHRLRVTDDGTTVLFGPPVQVAAGLRSATALAFCPDTGDLYIGENGVDTPGNGDESFSADELNVIPRALLDATTPPVQDFGFPGTYTEYRTATVIDDGTNPGTVPASIAFTPVPNPADGAESEGVAGMTFAPAGFPPPLNTGLLLGFHGKFSLIGSDNEENAVVHADPATGAYFHLVPTSAPAVGHPNTLLAGDRSLYIADFTNQPGISAGNGIIYQIVPAIVCEADGDASAVTVTDLLAYLAAWFLGDASADLNADTIADITDLLEFLVCWFESAG